MTEFIASLSFSSLSLALVAAFSIIMPSMGAVLAIRTEMMLALALPSVANAGMALGLLCGIDPEHELLLYGFATIATLISIFAASRIRNGESHREIYLAALFIGGQILSSTFSAFSPVAHDHVAHLLNGEVLAVGGPVTLILVIICAVFLVIGCLKARTIFSWSADSEFYRIGSRRYALFLFTIYAALASVITLGVATIGALLVTALLVLPALLADTGFGGIRKYIILATVTGSAGCIGGFLTALAVDFPPAISASAGIGVAGICIRIVCRRNCQVTRCQNRY